MAELKAHVGAGMAFGVAMAGEAAYPYSLEMARKGDKSAFTFRLAVAAPVRAAAALLNKQKLPHLRWAAEDDGEAGGVLVAWLSPPSDFYAKVSIRDTLAAATRALAAQGLKADETCPLCGLENCDTLAYLQNGYRKTHAACLQARLTLPDADVQPPKRVRGHVATGILGALLGALLGILPNWTYVINNHEFSIVFYAFVPLISALMYRLCRGRASQWLAGLSVLLCSLAASFALELFGYWLYQAVVLGNPLTLWQGVQGYFATRGFLEALGEMWLSLAVLLAGFIAAGFILRRYVVAGVVTPPPVRGKITVLASARPLREEAPQAPEEPKRKTEP